MCAKRKLLLESMDAVTMRAVDTEILHAWAAEMNKMNPVVREFVPENPPSEFLEAHYYDIMFRMYALVVSISPSEF